MGYESKIYVVDKSDMIYDGVKYSQVIASFDMCCYPDLKNIFKNQSDCGFCYDDGSAFITQDRYGETLKECSISALIDFLQNQIDKGEKYRRIKPLLALLKGFDESEWENLVCLHYGH